MLGPRTTRLLEIASDSLGEAMPVDLGYDARVLGLEELLAARNGFVAFESSLHVLPSGRSSGRTIEQWNAPDGWRAAYGAAVEGLLFFAEDVFGGQFALRGERICSFDPEIGEPADLAASVEEWVDQVLDDYEVVTGYPLAHAWQLEHGPLPPGVRLVPKTPFVLQGDFAVENLYPLDAETAMRMRADLARQIRDLPDGTPMTYRISD